jgi:hypothetical protein
MQTSRRPKLTELPLRDVWPPRPGLAYMTLSPGQWDATLQATYDLGYVLVEVDSRERPVKAYRTPALN